MKSTTNCNTPAGPAYLEGRFDCNIPQAILVLYRPKLTPDQLGAIDEQGGRIIINGTTRTLAVWPEGLVTK